ncbi:MAG TPA: response regulator [Vicinamibacteria bacterium]|nr:response regulator [Vicinamibacteria bacterium]
MAIRALVVDDERLARDELCFLLESFPEVEVVGQAGNGLEAVSQVERLRPELLFLDIQMPGLDGFQVLRELVGKDTLPPRVVFVTAYDQYAIQAFEINAVDYLLKPVEKVRLAEAIARSRREIGEEGPLANHIERILGALDKQSSLRRMVVKVGERFMLVDSKDIIYATVEDGIVTLATDEWRGTSNLRTLDELIANLDPAVFWRVHRSYVVNLRRIKEVIPWFNRTLQLKMADDGETEIPVSRSQTRRLKEHFRL